MTKIKDPRKLTTDDDLSALRLPHSKSLEIVRALMEYEGRKDIADGVLTLPALRPFVYGWLFTETLTRLAEEIRNLRVKYDDPRKPDGYEQAELEPKTFAGTVLESLASYLDCAAEDGTWSADTFSGLATSLENDMIGGVNAEELQLTKDHPALHWATRQHAADPLKLTPIRELMAKQGFEGAEHLSEKTKERIARGIEKFAPAGTVDVNGEPHKIVGVSVVHDRAAIDEHLKNAPKKTKIAWVTPPCEHYARRSVTVKNETTFVTATNPPHENTPTAEGKHWSEFTAKLPEVGHWKAHWEFPGAILWSHPGLDVCVYATPDWDGKLDEIAIQVSRVRDGSPVANGWTGRDTGAVSNYPTRMRWPRGTEGGVRTVESYMERLRPLLVSVEDEHLLQPQSGAYQGRDMFDDVMKELQNAEDMGGPDGEGYIALMTEIARECTRRANNYRETLAAKKGA